MGQDGLRNSDMILRRVLGKNRKLFSINRPGHPLNNELSLMRNLQAPLSSHESKYCQVSMTGGVGLEFSFTLR